jgi:hypothetical protein
LVAIVTKRRSHASKLALRGREFRLLLECRNSPCLPHNAFKKLPPWSGMSRDAYLDFDPPQSRRRWLAKIAIENHARH